MMPKPPKLLSIWEKCYRPMILFSEKFRASAKLLRSVELTVLVGKITFQVIVDISTDDEENLSITKKLAQEVLNKCK